MHLDMPCRLCDATGLHIAFTLTKAQSIAEFAPPLPLN